MTCVIGDRNYWAKGSASYAISEVIKIASRGYSLNKLVSSAAVYNIGSLRVLEKMVLS